MPSPIEGAAPASLVTGAERAVLMNLAVLGYSSLLWLVLPHRSTFRSTEVPAAMALERRWEAIRAEVDDLLALAPPPALRDVEPGHRRISPDDKWRVSFLKLYGREVDSALDCCPATRAVLDELPDAVNVLVSVLEPGKRIPWHPGIMKGVIRCHLPLQVPTGDCGIQVGRERFRWEPGVALLFDDCYPHRAWNATAERRVVLLVDVVRPMPWRWLDRMNRRVIARLGRSARFRNTVERADRLVVQAASPPVTVPPGPRAVWFPQIGS